MQKVDISEQKFYRSKKFCGWRRLSSRNVSTLCLCYDKIFAHLCQLFTLTVVETLKCKTRPSQTWGMTKVPHAVNSRCNQLTNRKWHPQKMVLRIFPATHLFFHLPCSLLAQLDQTLPADWTSRVMRPPEKGHREITGVNTKVYWDQWPPVM